VAKRKLSLVDTLVEAHSILALQEVHGNKLKFEAFTHRIQRQYFVFSSFSHKMDEAGVVTLVAKHGCSTQDGFREQVLVPGRVLRVVYSCAPRVLVHWNVHNFGIDPKHMEKVICELKGDLDRAAADPLGYVVVVAGDFNFLPKGECQRSLAAPMLARTRPGAVSHIRPTQRCWERELNRMVEVSHNLDTHYSAWKSLCSRIDRIYVSLPPWLVIQLSLVPRVYRDPKAMHEDGLSDHSPFSVTVFAKKPLPPERRPISKHVASSPAFKRALSALTDAACLDELSPPMRLQQHKVLIREAARIARDDSFINGATDATSLSAACATVARCVWNNDIRVYRILVAGNSFAAGHLELRDGMVCLKDAEQFEAKFTDLKHKAHEDRLLQMDMEKKRATRPDKVEHRQKKLRVMMAKQMQLWCPFGKRLVLNAVSYGGELLRDPDAKLSALASEWRTTFAHRVIDVHSAETFLRDNMSTYDFSAVTPPTMLDFKRFLKSVPHSAPGCDGIPYAAWRHSGDLGARTLFEASLWLQSGLPLHMEFNDALTAFTPKGETDDDKQEVVREPDSTRPLSLKNTDNKSICAVLNRKIRHPIRTAACKIQRGFIVGRNFVDNIVDLDTVARIYGMNPLSLLPLLALYDFGAAFPSVIHQWLFLCLQFAGIPEGMMNIFYEMYSFVAALGYSEDGVVRFLFWILSGVLQGCPLAGSFFALAMDPFLNVFFERVERPGLGVIRACADDIGAAVSNITSLGILKQIFEHAERLAGLRLKAAKGCFVPLHAPLSEELVEEIEKWLSEHIPEWLPFKVASAGKYLGAYLGPGAASSLWLAPSGKWLSRAKMVAASSMPTALSAQAYNKRVITTLGYVAQFSRLPPAVIASERGILAGLLHVPHNAFAHADYFHLWRWGSIKIMSVQALTLAILMRSALKTLSTWPQAALKLQHAAQEHLPAIAWMSGRYSPQHWDSPPLAMVLKDAAAGFPTCTTLCGAGSRALAAARDALSAPLLPSGKPAIKLQHAIYEALMGELYPDKIEHLFERRARSLVPSRPLDIDQLDDIRPLLVKLTVPVATYILKTWAGAWCTSARFHEEVRLPCLYGCRGEPDALQHYLVCPRLWRTVAVATHQRVPDDPLERLCVRNCSRSNLRLLSVASRSYHTLKLSHRDEAMAYIAEGEIRSLAVLAKNIARASEAYVASGWPRRF